MAAVRSPGNLVSLCATCHLELVHLNRMAVTGDADSGLAWRAHGWDADGRIARGGRDSSTDSERQGARQV